MKSRRQLRVVGRYILRSLDHCQSEDAKEVLDEFEKWIDTKRGSSGSNSIVITLVDHHYVSLIL
ncbi:MAG: hypothetical protein ACW98F_12815 [Candidatus Hodarchaeales archaeon]